MPIRTAPVSSIFRVPLLSLADGPLIRAAIRADLGVGDLSDFIVGTSFSPATFSVRSMDVLAGTYPSNSDQAGRAHDAAVLFAAAYLIQSLPQLTSERFRDYEYRTEPVDVSERVSMLRGLAYTLLAANLGVTLTQLLALQQMTLAPGGRGDIGVPWTLDQANRIGLSGFF